MFLSFIIPVYNVKEDQLQRCVDSLDGQTGSYPSFEYIIVDDGSNAATAELCDRLTAGKPNAKVIHQENQGLSVVRNVGVEAATGEWVSFVDGDDWIDEHYASIVYEMAQKVEPDTDIMIWDGWSETEKSSSPIGFMDCPENETMVFRGKEKEKLIDRIIPLYVTPEDIRRCTDIGITWGRAYRKSMLTDNHVYNIPGLRIMQDSIFNLWAIEVSRTIVYQNKPIYHYSMYDGSISKKQDDRVIHEMEKLYGHFCDYVNKYHNDAEYKQRINIRAIRLIVKCLAKNYANIYSKKTFLQRRSELKHDLLNSPLYTAVKECDIRGQELKLKVIHFMLKHHLWGCSIMLSSAFSRLRSIKNNVT